MRPIEGADDLPTEVSTTCSKTWGPNTLNNYTSEDVEKLRTFWASDVTRMRIAFEVGECGTPHLQFMITFKTSKRFSFLKKNFPRVSWRKTNCYDSAYLYCAKVTEGLIDIDNRAPGARKDIVAAYDAAKSGVTLRDFMSSECPNLQTIRVFQLARLVLMPPREEKPINVIWIYGSTATGKSKKARNTPEWGKPFCRPAGNSKWWDGYDGEKTVLFDEVRAGFENETNMLRFTDRYPFTVEVKGSTVNVQYDTLIMTSNISPEQYWLDSGFKQSDLQVWMRRLTRIIHMADRVVPLAMPALEERCDGDDQPASHDLSNLSMAEIYELL